jgi:hypothetical protein
VPRPEVDPRVAKVATMSLMPSLKLKNNLLIFEGPWIYIQGPFFIYVTSLYFPQIDILMFVDLFITSFLP